MFSSIGQIYKADWFCV